MKLTPRLQVIADSINHEGTLADVGTDHAYLPIYLVLEGRIQRAIASDINKGPIEIARKGIALHKLETKIEARHGGGLTILEPGEADVIVIAGMGGILISEIIQQSRAAAETAKVMILQPMQDSGKLRCYLVENGFEILDEEMAQEDKKLYEILWVKYSGISKAAENLMEIGPKLIEKKHPLALSLVDKRLKELHNILEKLESSQGELIQKRQQECKELLNYYNEVKQCLQ